MSDAAENVKEKAARLGLTLVEAGPHDIFVDIDQAGDLYVLEAVLPILQDAEFSVTLMKTTYSQHGGKHVWLRASRDLTDLERLFLQAVLGSDRKREALGFVRVMRGTRPVTVFFEVPEPPMETLPF